jgi:hypothetical protein
MDRRQRRPKDYVDWQEHTVEAISSLIASPLRSTLSTTRVGTFRNHSFGSDPQFGRLLAGSLLANEPADGQFMPLNWRFDGGPGWYRTSDLPRVRRLSRRGSCVHRGDGPGMSVVASAAVTQPGLLYWRAAR